MRSLLEGLVVVVVILGAYVVTGLLLWFGLVAVGEGRNRWVRLRRSLRGYRRRRRWLMHWKPHWQQVKAVRSGDQLSFGERAADIMRNSMGSWRFVGLFLLFMAVWALLNMALLRTRAFDPYPFILLNLLLSTMAGLQAAALLIAAKRADHIASEIALHTERNTEFMLQLLKQNTDLTADVHKLAADLHRHLMEGAEGSANPRD